MKKNKTNSDKSINHLETKLKRKRRLIFNNINFEVQKKIKNNSNACTPKMNISTLKEKYCWSDSYYNSIKKLYE